MNEFTIGFPVSASVFNAKKFESSVTYFAFLYGINDYKITKRRVGLRYDYIVSIAGTKSSLLFFVDDLLGEYDRKKWREAYKLLNE